MPVPAMDPARTVGVWTRLSAISPYLLTAMMLCLGLLVTPFVCHRIDMIEMGWLPWSRASAGVRPWDIYRTDFPIDCDYPPFVPYLLTLAERLRLLSGAPEVGWLSITLIKLPNLLAYVAGVPLCLLGLRRVLGAKRARIAAVLYALCLPLFVNAAMWGQFDALLSLAVLMAVVALLNDRPGWAGAAMGWALAIKFQAIVAVPASLVWVWRRHGAKGLGAGLATGFLVLGLFALPHVLGGGTEGMITAYTGAVDYYPKRRVTANNVWHLLDRYDISVRGIPVEIATSDARSVLGPITYKHLGLLALALYTLFLMAALWRRPTRYNLVLATALNVFAFFMLPTQMHERYVVPAVALLVLIAQQSRRALILFLWLTLSVSLSQVMVLIRHNALSAGITLAPSLHLSLQATNILTSLANTALFFWATYVFWQEAVAHPLLTGATTDRQAHGGVVDQAVDTAGVSIAWQTAVDRPAQQGNEVMLDVASGPKDK